MVKNLLAGAAFFLSLTALLFAQSITGVSIIGVKLGAQGGSGDVVGPSSSVDSEVALYSGTTGKLLKRASITGIPVLSSGVLGVVTGTATDCIKVNGTSGACGGGGGGSYSAGDGIDGTSLSGSTIAVDSTVPALAAEGSQSLTFNGGSAMASGSCYSQSLTATGAQPGDKVAMSWPATIPSGLSRSATVTGTDTITVELCKISTGTATVTGLTFGYQIQRTR